MLYTPMLSLESFVSVSEAVTPIMAGIANVLTVSLYIMLFFFGALIVIYALFRYLKNRRVVLPEHLTIGLYCLICIAFGILVSYTDFWE